MEVHFKMSENLNMYSVMSRIISFPRSDLKEVTARMISTFFSSRDVRTHRPPLELTSGPFNETAGIVMTLAVGGCLPFVLDYSPPLYSISYLLCLRKSLERK